MLRYVSVIWFNHSVFEWAIMRGRVLSKECRCLKVVHFVKRQISDLVGQELSEEPSHNHSVHQAKCGSSKFLKINTSKDEERGKNDEIPYYVSSIRISSP